MKMLLVAFGLLLLAGTGNSLYGQTTGDYRSRVNGTWTTLATWERYNGATWLQPDAGQGYPAQYNAPSRIDIGHNVTLNTDLPNNSGNRIIDLYINSGTLELANRNFTVNGLTNISGTLSDNNTTGIVIFYGIVTVTNTGIWTSVSGGSDRLQIHNNIVNNSNNVNLERLRIYANVAKWHRKHECF